MQGAGDAAPVFAMTTLAPYDPRWPAMFDIEAGRIQSALGAAALRIEHVGSTAVPGLAAKPVIDLQVSVGSLEPPDRFIEPLAALGYRHIPLGPFDAVYPYFCKPAEGPHASHVHLCAAGSKQESEHLAFRDHLRRHPKDAQRYLALKRRLARLHDGATIESQERYSLGKTAFIASVIPRALTGYTSLHAPVS